MKNKNVDDALYHCKIRITNETEEITYLVIANDHKANN